MIKRLLLPASLFLVMSIACHNTSGAPPMPDGVRFVPRTAWGTHAPVLPMTQHVPDRATIHDTDQRRQIAGGRMANPAFYRNPSADQREFIEALSGLGATSADRAVSGDNLRTKNPG